MKNKILILSALALVLSSCEYEFDVDVPLSGPIPMVEFLDGFEGDSTRFHIYKLYPVGSKIQSAADFELKSLSLCVDGVERPVDRIEGTSWFKTAAGIPEGSRMELSFVMDALPEAKASATKPHAPHFEVEGTRIEEDRCLWDLRIEDHKEGDFYALSVMAYRDGMWQDITVETSSGNSILATPFMYRIYWKWWDRSLTLNVVDEEMASGGRIQFETYSSAEQYNIALINISPEVYYYLIARYNQDNNVLAMLNLSPPNFAYSNVEKGFGLFGAAAFSETTLNIPLI